MYRRKEQSSEARTASLNATTKFDREENRRRNTEARRIFEKPTSAERQAIDEGAEELLKAMGRAH